MPSSFSRARKKVLHRVDGGFDALDGMRAADAIVDHDLAAGVLREHRDLQQLVGKGDRGGDEPAREHAARQGDSAQWRARCVRLQVSVDA